MSRNEFSAMTCSVARALDAVGDPWTGLILRDLSLGITRFDTIQRNLGISRKLLSQRLQRMAEHGIVERVPYQDNPPRYDYRLTEKGDDLGPVLLALKAWGDRWAAGEDGIPMLFRHDRCGNDIALVPVCPVCEEVVQRGDVTPTLGPGFESGPGTSEIPTVVKAAA